MSTQKGNTHRTRPQKHRNQFAFKNTLHDTSHKTKTINSLQIANVCERCKKILEWKIKYKKYKPLKAPGICNKCDQKTVKHAYHTMCGPCARERDVCPKCGLQNELVAPQPTKEEQLKLDNEMQSMLKTLPERKRRTFIRYMNKNTKKKRKERRENEEYVDSDSETDDNDEERKECTRDDLINKLKSLMIEEHKDDDGFDSDLSDDELDSDD
ncbi:uncharacterized protein C9orf85 homolog isoform X2 [Nasonia vitripennis]|uniref:Uncharacterized protein n=1 Tax=Nasonia vitripennis TaxID=7425 RepID=A0A7M7HDI3_NASVI|nr:uncharacterized protein C9orf85 homolog isoform X2 [Nasonia vitripennis]